MPGTHLKETEVAIPPALLERLRQHEQAHAASNVLDSKHQIIFSRPVPPDSPLQRRLNAFLRPTLSIFHKKISAYNAFGVMGMALAAGIAIGLTLAKGLTLWVTVGLLLLALIISLIHIIATTLITGRDSLVYLRYFLSIMAGAAILLRTIDQPVLPYLENLMLGIGAMQGIGRIGCLRVGCCYGKPARYGIRYTHLHARAGFPKYLVGVRLLPVQLIESCWILFSAVIGVFLALRSGEAGYGMASHIVLFSTGRCFLELLRGDRARPYAAGFSEAQWLSMIMVAGLLFFESVEILPFHLWHFLIAAFLFTGMLIHHWRNRWSTVGKLTKPAALHELGRALDILEKGRAQQLAGSHAVHVRQIEPDLLISDGIFTDVGTSFVHHFTLSYTGKEIPQRDAVRLSEVLSSWPSRKSSESNVMQSWQPEEEKTKLLASSARTFHLLRYHTFDHAIDF